MKVVSYTQKNVVGNCAAAFETYFQVLFNVFND